MTKIVGVVDAIAEAERILAPSEAEPTAFIWKTVAIPPLAAILLTVAHTNDGVADLEQVRDIAGRPVPDTERPEAPSWLSVAKTCSYSGLANVLASTEMNARQRDSLKNAMVGALDNARP